MRTVCHPVSFIGHLDENLFSLGINNKHEMCRQTVSYCFSFTKDIKNNSQTVLINVISLSVFLKIFSKAAHIKKKGFWFWDTDCSQIVGGENMASFQTNICKLCLWLVKWSP